MMPVRILLQSPDTGDIVELGRGEIDDVGNSTGPWLRQVPGILEQIAAQLTAAMDLVDAQRVDVVEQAPEPAGARPVAVRGRVLPAAPVEVTSLDTNIARHVPGGWLAEVLDSDGHVIESSVRADEVSAVATCEYLLRMHGGTP